MAERGTDVVGVVNYMKKKGSLKVIVIGFILGLALLIFGSLAIGDGEKGGGGEVSDTKDSYEAFLEYKLLLRQEIESACLSVRGVKSAHAVVFFDGIGESIYAQNTQSGNTERNEYVIIGSGSGSHALYLGESLPPLSGIGVVCETGGSDAVKNEIAALLSAAYGLPLTRIYVSEG